MKKIITSILQIFIFIIISNLCASCKRDGKISMGGLKEGYYELEILNRYEYPPDSTEYLKKSVKAAQIYTLPRFLITKSLKVNHYSACVTDRDFFYPGCDVFNCNLEVIYVNDDSVYFQNPICRVMGNRDGFIPTEPFGPQYFVDSTIKYQAHISGLQLNTKLDLKGTWKELVACKYISQINGIDQIDSIIDRQLFVQFRLKFIKSL
jgi:hypothetical protein